MKVVFEGSSSSNSSNSNNIVVVPSAHHAISKSVVGGTGTSLKSAIGASTALKVPKSSNAVKIHPDINAIHKVLFQPTSSSNATKMLFKRTGH